MVGDEGKNKETSRREIIISVELRQEKVVKQTT